MNTHHRVLASLLLGSLIGAFCPSVLLAEIYVDYSMNVEILNGTGTSPVPGKQVAVWASNPPQLYQGITDNAGNAAFAITIPVTGARLEIYVEAAHGSCPQYLFAGIEVENIGPDFVLVCDSGLPGGAGAACAGANMCGYRYHQVDNDTFTLMTNHYAVPLAPECRVSPGE